MSGKGVVKARLSQGVTANILGRPAQLVLELVASVMVARYLGPELLAVLVAIRALANFASSVGDFGITVSLSKIVPDLAALHGPQAALRAARDLTLLRLLTVPLVGLAGFWLARADFVEIGDIELSWAMASASIVLAAFTLVNGSRRYVILAALRLRDIVVVDVIASIVGPAVNVLAAVLTRDPLIVALSTVLTELVVFIVLHGWLSYDLDPASPEGNSGAIDFRELVRRYRPFVAMAYAKYIFNRVVLRNPALLVILGLLGASSAEIGNAAIALSLTFQAWEIANIPLAQMRAPLLSRLHVRNDRAGMEALESVSVSVITISSCLLAVAALAGAEPLVATVYGPAYADAARWAAVACAVGLLANILSLGNTTLQQLEQYRVQAVAMAAAVGCIIVGLGVILAMNIAVEPTLAALILMVLARTSFWLLTDLWADRAVFNWAYTAPKIRGALAAVPAMAVAVLVDAATLAGGLVAAAVSALLFMIVFRALGGVGHHTRNHLRRMVPARVRPLLALV